MSEFYGTPKNELEDEEQSFFDKIAEALRKATPAFILGIYNGNITPDKPFKRFFDEYLKSQNDGIFRAFGATDSELKSELLDNVFVFSAAKSHQVAAEATALLFDNGGVKLPFNEFRELVTPVLNNYNKNWLKTEYQTAILQSENAKKWQEIEEESDVFPLLQYKTAQDERVRDDHRPLSNVIKPVNDPFWNTYYPQNGWGCRCRVKQLKKGRITKKVKTPKVPKLFKNNPAKTGYIYDEDSHPYFKVEERYKTVKKDNFGFKQ